MTFHKKGRKMRRDPKAQKKASLESCRELSEPHHEMPHLRDESIKISAALQKMVDFFFREEGKMRNVPCRELLLVFVDHIVLCHGGPRGLDKRINWSCYEAVKNCKMLGGLIPSRNRQIRHDEH